ncbi:hypothetical protein GRF29_69g300524 [Pseudopithomyces chartarum]|uniref:HAUS augmin-like complex subunit 6 N-terminal domain-containing protein n=1 Tax=Pseudopithomyces chartarum TaxID=1892770 RepID=A0AAN6RI73_9PLEO|nr:hypothetical protein GRF29_69g300524 [Pseudopithomyces chartarum]
MSRTTTSQTQTAAPTATGGVARSLSLKTNTAKLLQTSDVTLFVTNLRLLDLDQRDDWPHVTVQTFSAKNADQKQRIGAVEWALFRLFEIWDPQETSQKLQPFFPPLEPLQSRNLRIALHRSLDTLKKDGVLGRETVLRKTMLDECKGEKFFEVLASFSAIVLKKVLASQPAPQSKTAVARKLATSTSLSNQEQASLLPLAIAHRAALVNLLRKKEEKRARYMDFANLLDTKAEEINKRIRKAVGTPRSIKPAVPQREADAIKKQLKDNWIGDQRWVDVILHGDDAQADAGFLNAPFQKVWRVVDQGRRLEDAVPEVGLLENLQLRVDEQKARLDKWKEFHTRMQGGMAASNTPKESNIAAKEFKFDDHLQFQLRKETSATEPAQPQKLRPAYQDILLDMDEELAQAATARYNRSSAAPLVPGRRTSYAPVHHVSRSQSDLVPSGTSRIAKPPISSRIKSDNIISRRPSLLARPSATAPINSEATLVGRTSTLYTAASPSPTTNPPTESPPESPTEPPTESYSPPLPQHAPIDDLPSAPTAPASPEQTPIINSPSPPSSPLNFLPLHPHSPPSQPKNPSPPKSSLQSAPRRPPP